jgi:hypothetical protein
LLPEDFGGQGSSSGHAVSCCSDPSKLVF